MDVLEDMSSGQVNLESEAARRTIATMITAALKEKGEYKKHTNDELEEQEARKYWVCKICGQSSYDLDWDYIGSGTNHLSCEVRLEIDEKKLKERDKKLYEDQRDHIEQDMAPFGFISDGVSEEVSFVDPDGDRWYTDEYGDKSTDVAYMWEYM